MSDKCNQKVEELKTDSKNGYSSNFKPILQLILISDIEKFEDLACENTFHKFLDQTKGMIYIQNCKFNEELKKNCKRWVPIHPKRKWGEFHEVKEL